MDLDDGVVGWDYNHGRVVCLSTVAGPAQMQNANYARMLINSLDWVRDIAR